MVYDPWYLIVIILFVVILVVEFDRDLADDSVDFRGRVNSVPEYISIGFITE